ncbi:MAG: YicC/YloC family endoribonuclease [Pseudomonadota bacterium]
MALHSMTGFARSEGNDANASWFWEAKSVNGRGLDIKLRLPAGYERLDAHLRALVAKTLKRGNVAITLSVHKQTHAASLQLNEAVLGQILAAGQTICERTGASPATVDGILSIKGVLELVEAEESDDNAERDEALKASFAECLNDLVTARQTEGAQLETALLEQISEIEKLTARIQESPARTPEAIATRLAETVAKLVQSEQGLQADRLHQEAVLLATKADLDEELTRLRAHVVSARDHVASSGPVGRKLDFLAQEFNREANTICSKSNHIDVTDAGMGMKVVIDQLREQVQNVE